MFQGPLFQVTIDELHKNVEDSHLGYKECVAHATDESLKAKFVDLAAKREQMKHDLEVYAGAMQSTWGSVKSGLTQAWLDIQTGLKDGTLKDGTKVGEAICHEEIKLKKVYNSALKSQGIALSLNGLLLVHISKIETDLRELESTFGIERKVSQPSTPERSQRKLSVGDKIKSAFGIEDSGVNFEPPTIERRQSFSDKLKSAFGMEASNVSFEPPAMERRQSIGDKIKSAFGMESPSVNFEPPKMERRTSIGDKIKSAFRTDSPTKEKSESATAHDKAIQKAALTLDDRCQTYKKRLSQTKFSNWEG